MKRKKQNEPKRILEKATKEAERRWGYEYPFRSLFVSDIGFIFVIMFVVMVPAKIIGMVYEDTALQWLQFVDLGTVIIPLVFTARRFRRRIRPYLEKVLAELNNPDCRKCEYDLRGLTDFHRCPECGTPVIWVETKDNQS